MYSSRTRRGGMGYLLKTCSSIESGQDRRKKDAMQACLYEHLFCEWPMRRQGELAAGQESALWREAAQPLVRAANQRLPPGRSSVTRRNPPLCPVSVTRRSLAVKHKQQTKKIYS